MKTINRYKIGQRLLFLKTAITNKLGITNINQSVAYIAVLDHDESNKFTYNLSFPFTLTRRKGCYSESYYLGKMTLLLTILSLLTYLVF